VGYQVINFKCPLIISNIFQKNKRAKLRLINKGYKYLQDSNQLDLIMQLRSVLTKTELRGIKTHSVLLFKNSINIELSTRQYLTVRILGKSFNEDILYSIGSDKPFRHPMPSEWRNVLISKGIQVDSLSCALLWRQYVILLWGYGVWQWLRSLQHVLCRQPELGNHVYFNDLGKHNISSSAKDHNIVNWYLQWENRNKDVNTICHSINNLTNFKNNGLDIVNTDGLPQLMGVQKVYYCICSVYLIAYSLTMMFVRPYYSFMLGEAIKLVRVNLANNDQLASDYLFHNSGPLYRPIWTYEAHRRKSRVLFYFYSTNNENFKTVDGYPVQNPWHLISWPYYLVWDQYQVNFVKKNDRHDSVIEIVGSIWFSSNNEKNLTLPLASIAVFDVQPMRSSYYLTLGLSSNFFKGSTANKFLSDIQLILDNNQTFLAHKRKRTSPLVNKKYRSNVKRLMQMQNYIEISADLDATQLIQKTKACISMPFTSTALIAQFEGKPSVYYDPYGTIQKDDIAAHGIPILSGIDELNTWVRHLGNE